MKEKSWTSACRDWKKEGSATFALGEAAEKKKLGNGDKNGGGPSYCNA